MGLTEWDVEQLKRLANGNQNAGRIVITKTGLIGRTYNRDPLINGKQPVYTDKGKLLCDPGTLTLRGFID
jgi:hypothetical protein